MKKLISNKLQNRILEGLIILVLTSVIQLVNYCVNSTVGLYDNMTQFQKWAHYGVDVAMLYLWMVGFFVLDFYAAQARKKKNETTPS